MKDDPYFSIIVPSFNRAGFIQNTLQSVLNQSFKNFEIIFVDDGSSDNTQEIISKISDARLKYYYKKNEERGASRNYGIKKSKGKYITFLDSDDLLYINCFETVFNYISQYNCKFLSCAYDTKDSYGNIINPYKKLKGNLNKMLQFGNFLSCIGVFCERTILDKNHFSNKRKLSGSEDWLLWLKLASNYRLDRINTPLACIIEHDYRSVNNFSENQLVIRRDLLIRELKNTSSFNSYYGKNGLKNVLYHMNTYIALHLALKKADKKSILKYFYNGVINSPKELFSRRTLAIIKHLL